MRRFPAIFLLLTLVLLSCAEDEQPETFLEGTYENAQQSSLEGVTYINQYQFHSDGTIINQLIYRDSESGEDAGYYYKSIGTYSLRGTDFSRHIDKAYGVDFKQYPEGVVDDPSELSELDFSTYAVAKGRLRSLDKGNKIAIVFECSDILSSCIGEQEYIKIK